MTPNTVALQHVAIILDGNRTWAKERGLPKFVGHTEGAKNIRKIVLSALQHNIPFLTLYILSTENLKEREPKELDHLFSLFRKIGDYFDLFQENNIRFTTIGNTRELPENVQDALEELRKKTQTNTALTLTFAVNYGGRDEIVRAIQKIHNTANMKENDFAQYLDTKNIPDVDLMIRTGGYYRMSNFLPWQSIYAELYFTKTRWPAFSRQDLQKALQWFAEQKRKKGK